MQRESTIYLVSRNSWCLISWFVIKVIKAKQNTTVRNYHLSEGDPSGIAALKYFEEVESILGGRAASWQQGPVVSTRLCQPWFGLLQSRRRGPTTTRDNAEGVPISYIISQILYLRCAQGPIRVLENPQPPSRIVIIKPLGTQFNHGPPKAL